LDQGIGGLNTAGGFRKLHLELKPVHVFGNAPSVHLTFQTQMASKNPASAENMALGVPTGTRAYPVGKALVMPGSC